MFDIEDVSARGMCIGCGACSVLTDGRIPMRFNEDGMWQASVEESGSEDRAAASRVCPFSDAAKSESALAHPSASDFDLPSDPRVGHYSKVLAGRQTDQGALLASSSGGMTSWLLERLLGAGHVDGVVHVGQSGDAGRLFDFRVSHTVAELSASRKSQYYSVSMAEVLMSIKGDGRRYAIVGVPCYIKAARLLAEEDPILGSQLRFFVGLVCGHMKSGLFAESLAWQLGVDPAELGGVDFRVKNAERPASQYDFEATSRRSGLTSKARTGSLVGSGWGHAVFQPEACNFCDDIFAETADVVFGDAWLEEFSSDWRGTNVVISRNPLIDQLLSEGQDMKELEFAPLAVDRVAASQAGNFRHRRDGLRLRLHDDEAAGLPVPRKRVTASADHVTSGRALLIRHRRRMSRESFVHFRASKKNGELGRYLGSMRSLIAEYDRLDRPSVRKRARILASRFRMRMRSLARRSC